MRLNRIASGWYASEDGRFAAVKDQTGYVTIEERDGEGIMAGCADDGWAALYDPAGRLREDNNVGETLNWVDTKREAVELLDWQARQVAR